MIEEIIIEEEVALHMIETITTGAAIREITEDAIISLAEEATNKTDKAPLPIPLTMVNNSRIGTITTTTQATGMVERTKVTRRAIKASHLITSRDPKDHQILTISNPNSTQALPEHRDPS